MRHFKEFEYEIDPEQERIRQRIERFSQFFGRVNSAFTFRKVHVRVVNSSLPAPAWSTSNEVTFNSSLIGDLTSEEQIAVLKGADLHEISHILYTPRESSEIGLFIQDNPKYRMVFNILEDQRIETFFTSKYPSTVKWFSSVIYKYFIDNPSVFDTSFPLLRGRKYLPVDVRKQSREAYEFQNLVPDIAQIIDEYCTLIFPTNSDRGIALIEELFALLPKKDDDGTDVGKGYGEKVKWKIVKDGDGTEGTPVNIFDPYGHGDRPHEGIESSMSRPLNSVQQERDRDRSSSHTTPDEIDTIDIDDIDFGDSDSGLDSDSDSKLNPQNENSSQAGKPTDSEKIETLFKDLFDTTLSDESVQQELSEMVRIISGLPSLATNNSEEPEKSPYKLKNPSTETLTASHRFGTELEKLKSSFDPAWERYTENGKLNVRRFIRGDDLDTIFDKWNEGIEEATEIECIVLLDNSGSMSGENANTAYQSMYAIKRALSKIEANCTVLTFSDNAQTLYRADEKALNQIRDGGVGGGTNPSGALEYATKLLAETEKPVKILFVITDGEWYSHDDNAFNHELIKRMGRSGVLTAFAYINEGDTGIQLTAETAHYCELGAVIRNPFDLISLARSIVKYAVARNLTRA